MRSIRGPLRVFSAIDFIWTVLKLYSKKTVVLYCSLSFIALYAAMKDHNWAERWNRTSSLFGVKKGVEHAAGCQARKGTSSPLETAVAGGGGGTDGGKQYCS